jgi:hypothetical protein
MVRLSGNPSSRPIFLTTVSLTQGLHERRVPLPDAPVVQELYCAVGMVNAVSCCLVSNSCNRHDSWYHIFPSHGRYCRSVEVHRVNPSSSHQPHHSIQSPQDVFNLLVGLSDLVEHAVHFYHILQRVRTPVFVCVCRIVGLVFRLSLLCCCPQR